MSEQNTHPQSTFDAQFDPASFLETAAKGRIIATHPKREIIFAQGDVADSVFYIKEGRAPRKLSRYSTNCVLPRRCNGRRMPLTSISRSPLAR